MNWKQTDKLSNVLALVLLVGAVGMIGWQGVRYLSEEQITEEPQRIQAMVEETSTAISTFSQTYTEVQFQTAVSLQRQTTASKSQPQTTKKKASGKNQSVKTEAVSVVLEEVQFPLELNAATVEELQLLPGIGPVLAQKIVAYREQIGGYWNREQLLEVSGIGEATLTEIYELVYLTEEQPLPISEEISEPLEIAEPAAQEREEQKTIPTEFVQTEMETSVITLPIQTEPIPVLDLNLMTYEELLLLPGMTEELAEEILAFRDEIGYFSSTYELLYVENVTTELFQEILDYVSVSDSETE